jgi:hypothetical protein
MVANETYSADYLAQSKATLLNTFYAIPIFLTLVSTSLRIWAKVRQKSGIRLGFDDYFMGFATVYLTFDGQPPLLCLPRRDNGLI